MWYQKHKELDFNKPIVAFKGVDEYLLVPCLIKRGSYEIQGYNWLSIKTGEYNSCTFFETPDAAMKAYRGYGFANASIQVNKGE